jgi:5-methylcytosine-specific restriction endonuclease McrA
VPVRSRHHPAAVSKHRPKVSKRRLAEIRFAVYERDGYTCQDCGWQPDEIPEGYRGVGALVGPAPAEELARPRHPSQRLSRTRVLELDHKTPYSKGGQFTVGNLQALCSTCNSRKGARAHAS